MRTKKKTHTRLLKATIFVLSLLTLSAVVLAATPSEKFCSVFPAICPVDTTSWVGKRLKADAIRWQDIDTNGPNPVWQWSGPCNEGGAFCTLGGEFRHGHYTLEIDGSFVDGEWEAWKQTAGYRMFQLGGRSQSEALKAGKGFTCTNGIPYPTMDQNYDPDDPYKRSDHYCLEAKNDDGSRDCLCGGYIASVRQSHFTYPKNSFWGNMYCNRVANPNDYPYANRLCKESPHLLQVQHRWVRAGGNGHLPAIGCEEVVYSLGWPDPSNPSTPADYATWFRNGYVKFGTWYTIPNSALTNPAVELKDTNNDGLPDYDADTWWNYYCKAMRPGDPQDTPNWYYEGVYKITNEVCTDTFDGTVICE